MKYLSKILLIIAISGLFSCTKDMVMAKKEKMTVTRDCSGTYVKYAGNDYLVCNDDKLKSFKEGDSIFVTMRKVDQCRDDGSNKAVCLLYHENKGMVEIVEVFN